MPLLDEEQDSNYNNPNFETLEQGIVTQYREMEENGECLQIRNLKKTYPNGKAAVKGVSMTMYKG